MIAASVTCIYVCNYSLKTYTCIQSHTITHTHTRTRTHTHTYIYIERESLYNNNNRLLYFLLKGVTMHVHITYPLMLVNTQAKYCLHT